MKSSTIFETNCNFEKGLVFVSSRLKTQWLYVIYETIELTFVPRRWGIDEV